MATNKTSLPDTLEKIALALLRADAEKQGHQAFLLYGPTGCGKRSIISYVLSHFSKYPDRDPDISTSDAKEESDIENIRSFIDDFHASALVAKRRIGVIYNIEFLTTQSLNALLKTLEEPPELSLILLTSSDMRFIPQTISSRTAKLYVPPLRNDELISYVSSKGIPKNTISDYAYYFNNAPEELASINRPDVRQSTDELIKAADNFLAHPLSIFQFTSPLEKDELRTLLPQAQSLWINRLRKKLVQSKGSNEQKRILNILKKLAHLSINTSSNLHIQLENIWVN